jgi:hypothetical protein
MRSVPTSAGTNHVCPVATAGGLIDPSWCFDTFAERLAGLPPIRSESDVLCPELLLREVGSVTVRYCPFDFVNRNARVVIVGITPGLHQMYLSCREAQEALAEGLTGDDVLRRACDVGSFAGSMRTNMVAMLDEIGLPRSLGISTTRELFEERSDLLHSTSALVYPVFWHGKNYGGSPNPLTVPLLQAFVERVFTSDLAMLPDALIIPLGRTVAGLLRAEVDRGANQRRAVPVRLPAPLGRQRPPSEAVRHTPSHHDSPGHGLASISTYVNRPPPGVLLYRRSFC